MSDFWDQRYADKEYYYYGKEPNGFFKTCIDDNVAGKLLLPGDGEGRNAVYAATKGWEVFAFDLSKMGQKKALMLAEENGVSINYKITDISDYPLEDNFFDMIALVYIHLYPEERIFNHKRFISALKPGGKLVIEVFSKKQIGNNSGGPKELALLYDVEDLKEDFRSLEIIHAEDVSIYHDESFAHRGQAEIIRFIGKKSD